MQLIESPDIRVKADADLSPASLVVTVFDFDDIHWALDTFNTARKRLSA